MHQNSKTYDKLSRVGVVDGAELGPADGEADGCKLLEGKGDGNADGDGDGCKSDGLSD